MKKDVKHKKHWITNHPSSSELFVELNEPLIEKPNSYKTEAKILAVNPNNNWTTAEGKIIIYTEKKSSIKKLRSGDRIIISNRLQLIRNTRNPGAFDYQSYCNRMGIYHQVYLRENDFIQIKESRGKNISFWFDKIRSHVLKILRNYIPEKRSLGIAEALLIGYKIDLDKDLVQAYSNTGVIHIIAISGLHLALIYGLLLKVADLLPYVRKRKIKWLFILILLWAFSILTGASPSVLRAAVMFSCIIIGKVIEKQPRPLNTLAASAFLLLMYNPFLLWDAGFQLSYAAVASIMILYKPIYRLWYFKNKLLDAFWKLNALAIAAQIFTLPFVIFHFKQFPNLFLFSNMIAVPLSGFILYAELLLIVCSSITIIAAPIGKLISFSIEQMNVFIEYVNKFAYAVTENLNTDMFSALLLTIVVLLAARYFVAQNKKALQSSLVLLLFLGFYTAYQNVETRKKSLLIIYNINKHSAAEIITGNQTYFFGDSIVLRTPSLFNFHIKPAHTKFNATKPLQYSNAQYFKAGEHCIYRGKQIPESLKTDLFILTGNPKLQAIQFAPNTPYTIVADNTNARWKINRWKKQADSLHLRFHSVPDDGAFIMEF